MASCGIGISHLPMSTYIESRLSKGTTNIKTLAKRNEEVGLKMRIVESKDHAEVFAMVESNTVDAFAIDDVFLYGVRANAANPKKISMVGKPMTIER